MTRWLVTGRASRGETRPYAVVVPYATWVPADSSVIHAIVAPDDVIERTAMPRIRGGIRSSARPPGKVGNAATRVTRRTSNTATGASLRFLARGPSMVPIGITTE